MSNRSAEAVCCPARVCRRATAEATLCGALVCVQRKMRARLGCRSKYRCLVFTAGRGRARRGGAQPNAQRMPREAHLRPAHGEEC